MSLTKSPFLSHIGVSLVENDTPDGETEGSVIIEINSQPFSDEADSGRVLDLLEKDVMDIIEADAGFQVLNISAMLERDDAPSVDRMTPLRFNTPARFIEPYIYQADAPAGRVINPEWEGATFSVCYPPGKSGLVYHFCDPRECSEFGFRYYRQSIRRMPVSPDNKLPCWYRRLKK